MYVCARPLTNILLEHTKKIGKKRDMREENRIEYTTRKQKKKKGKGREGKGRGEKRSREERRGIWEKEKEK